MCKSIEGVILAAGKGSRLNCTTKCKALTLINNRLLISYAVDALVQIGIKDIWIVKYTFDSFEELENYYQSSEIHFHYICDSLRNGSLTSFERIRYYITTTFIVLDCDLIVDKFYFAKMFEEGIQKIDIDGVLGVIALVDEPTRKDTDMVLVSGERVKGFLKYGGYGCVRGGYIFLWTPDIFCYIDSFIRRKVTSLSEYYNYYVCNKSVDVMHVKDIWDVDTIEDIQFTEQFMNRRSKRYD